MLQVQETQDNKSRFVETQLEMSKYIGKRKHGTQIATDEEIMIWDRLYSISNWSLATHALTRLEEKNINAKYNDIVSVIKNSFIIEYKIDYNKQVNRCNERVVLRSNEVINNHYNLYVVFNLTRKRIVTVWLNRIDDFHDTLNWDLYDGNMKVFCA